MLEQLVIVGFGLPAAWLVQSNSRKWRFVASLLGLAAQPAYFYTTWLHHQYGIFAMSFLYTGAWLYGTILHRPKN